MGREAIEGDGNFTVVLFNVDRNISEFNDVYGEANVNGIRFLPPHELKVIPILSEAENQSYNKDGGLRYLQDGNLVFGIYDQQLKELMTDINYGDYIGYPVSEIETRYFSVVNDGKKNFDNRHTIVGYKGAFRTITCASVDENEFKGV
jgi:hypothetical protein